jgi:hypothetical protein
MVLLPFGLILLVSIVMIKTMMASGNEAQRSERMKLPKNKEF